MTVRRHSRLRRGPALWSLALVALLICKFAASKCQLSAYALNVRISVKPEYRGEFLKCILANQRGTLTTEPLAVKYMFGEDENRPNTFHFHEQYKGREGFEAHTQTPHFAAWETFVAKDPFEEPPAVVFFEERDIPSPSKQNPASKYCLNVQMGIKPDKRDEFLECISNNQKGTLSSEPLAVEYVFGEDEGKANVFHFHEQYDGRDGFEAHTRQPHFQAWERFVEIDPFTEAPEVVFFKENDGNGFRGTRPPDGVRSSGWDVRDSEHTLAEERTVESPKVDRALELGD